MKIYLKKLNRAENAVDKLINKMKDENIWTDNIDDADYVLIIGDRIEQFEFALKCFRENKKIIHLWAGEQACWSTMDDLYRTSITLMSIAQLCSTQKAVERTKSICKSVFKKSHPFLIGNIMLDNMDNINKTLVPNFDYDLILYNPPSNIPEEIMRNELYKIRNMITPSQTIWIGPNCDEGSEYIDHFIDNLIINKTGLMYYGNLPRPIFLGLLKKCKRFITNSSCQFYEAPFLINKNQIISIGKRNEMRESKYSDLTIPNASNNVIEILKLFDKTKTCTKCGNDFPATSEYYVKDRTKKDKLNSSCKDCKSIIDKKYYLNHKDSILKYHHQYFQDNKEKIYEKAKNYNLTEHGSEIIKKSVDKYNKSEKRKESSKRYRKTDKGKQSMKKYTQSDKGKISNRRKKAKHKELGYIELFENPFPREIKVDYHHINDFGIVIPIPQRLHELNGYPDKDVHRDSISNVIKDLYGLDVNIFLGV